MNQGHRHSWYAQKAPDPYADDLIYANGIFADTGLPLCQISAEILADVAAEGMMSTSELQMTQSRSEDANVRHLGPIGEVDPNELSDAGWGIVFSAHADSRTRSALDPLIEHRRRQVTSRCDARHADVLFRVFDGPSGCRTNESATAWLARQGVGMHTVDPLESVPFYLLLVGSPEEISFEFQYLLDIYWGVGRLYFYDPDDYRRYALSLIDYETSASVMQSKSAVVFATRHNADRATQMFADEVASPLANGQPATELRPARLPIGHRQGFSTYPFIQELASKDSLAAILRGTSDAGSPALLFTGSHGVGFRPDDPLLESNQGALVCQDWTGWGGIESNHWFCADDVPTDARIQGLIHFFFACYGAGCPEFDNFTSRGGASPDKIAPRPLVARLPQKMLAHPNGGALASLGHVDRAWATSFRSHGAGIQLQGFRDVLGRILRGDRIGQATDQFDVRRAAMACELAGVINDRDNGKLISSRQVANLWIAYHDARNFVILGDPAVRLRVEEL